MKRAKSLLIFLFVNLFLLNFSARGQGKSMISSSLPPDVRKIISSSCMPCHSKDGGFKPRFKLNFTEWDKYSPEKKKAKADKMVSLLNKGEMPPKKAREEKPETIPTTAQIETIKKWSESLKDK